MSLWSGRSRKDKPCDSYSGNLCSGFGGECICFVCGWDRFDHKSKRDFDKLFGAEGEQLEK